MNIQCACIEFEIYVLSCQVCVIFTSNIHKDYQIAIEDKVIKITIKNIIYTLNVQDYTFEKNSFREVQVKQNKLFFRAQLACKPLTEASCFTFVSNSIPKIKTSEEIFIICKLCKVLINKQPFKFSRVLPIEIWEMDTDMFCHGGTEDLKFKAQDDDCYYDNISIYLKNKNSLLCDLIQCQNCKLCIGTKVDCGVRLWLDCIIIKHNDDSEKHELCINSFNCFAIIMDNFIRTMFGPMSYLILEYTDSSNTNHFLSMQVIKKSEVALCLNLNLSCDLILNRQNCSSIIWHTSSEFVSKWRNMYLVTEIQVSEKMYQNAVFYLKKNNQTFIFNETHDKNENSSKSYLFEKIICNI